MYKSFTRKSRALCLFLTLVGPAVGLAQPSDDRANAEALDALAADWAQRFEDEHAAALDWAKQQRWENTWIEHPDGTVTALFVMRDGRPWFVTTDNVNAADTVSTDEIQFGGSSGLNLDGAGVLLHIWDGGGVRLTHQEFDGRVSQVDSPSSLSNHATHVSGTMIARGMSASAHGMANRADLRAYDFFNDDAEMAATGASALLSNHSYGFVTGWAFGEFGAGDAWYWFGNLSVSPVEDNGFGRYSNTARSWDQIAFLAPDWLICKSAGNDRNDAHSGTHFHWQNGWVFSNDSHPPDCNFGLGYDCVSYQGCAKNILTVGAVRDIGGGYAGPPSVVMTSFSGWGPCDDGRIKPDIVANGTSLRSSTASSNTSYAHFSGTSMSSPNATGSLALLAEHYRDTHNGDDMRSATLKGIVIHTADEAGPAPGPDYSFGWGLLNSQSAAAQISLDEIDPTAVQELSLEPDQTMEFAGVYAGSGAIKATICWTDPPATPPPSSLLDPPTKMLVNDLDLRILGPGATTHEPWILDLTAPSAGATRGDNDTDNMEVVLVDAPVTGTYRIMISHKGDLENDLQAFSLIVSGLGELESAGACCTGLACEELLEEECMAANGFFVGFDTGCPGNDCNGNELPDECDIADGRSEDCDDNGVPDECDPDSDGDTVPDACDVCFGADDRIDPDGDGVPTGCDPCPLDNPDDSDGDGTCDTTDLCPGFDDRLDNDGDGVPDGCDACPGTDDNLPGQQDDDDGDGVLNCVDQCRGADDAIYTPQCVGAIPTLSAWGLTVLALTLLILAKVAFGRRSRIAKSEL